jgi:cytochrome c peroxidase
LPRARKVRRLQFMKLQNAIAILIATTSSALTQQLPPPVGDSFYEMIDLQEAMLGQLLFYDPILSGNREIACATCHHPAFGTSDGVSLSFGDGGIGLGPTRIAAPDNIPEERIPRNSPALFNLGASEFHVLFHDGRLEADETRPAGIRTPMADDMAVGFNSVLSAQTMFPVLSRDEMAGSYDENEIGRLIRQGIITGDGGAWDVLARRVAEIPEYRDAFIDTYPHIEAPDDIEFTDLSNAIAVFIAHEWRSDTSPFDAVLRGQQQFSGLAQDGLDLFYGSGGCVSCHTGPFLTDHQFHAMGAPQIGPGKSATFEDHARDDGRFRVTGREEDRFAFRTPSLRNVALTAPYGHAGAHTDLTAFIASHVDPRESLLTYESTQALLPPFEGNDFSVMEDAVQVKAIRDAITTPAVELSQNDIAAIVEFLHNLTDPISLTGRLGIPDAVPSGLVIPNPD